MLHKLVSILVILVFLSGCASINAQPTGVSQTMEEPTPTPEQSPTPIPIAETEPPLPVPSLTPEPTLAPTGMPVMPTLPVATATPVIIPEAAIQVNSPGPLSKVISPMRVRGYVLPGAQNHVHVELIGEDGRLIFSKLMIVYTAQKWAYLSVDIPFEISGAGEYARLQVSTQDEEGRIDALSSVHVLLLSSGYDEINPPGDLRERCVLTSPQPGEDVNGSLVVIEGKFRPFNSEPVIVEVMTTSGQVVSTLVLALSPTEKDEYIPFSVELPYLVEGKLPVRLSLRQGDDRFEGPIYLFSQEITLYP